MSEPNLQPGTVREVLENALFRIQLDDGRSILVHLAPELRRVSVRLLPGDRVEVALSPYDTSRGRIVARIT